MHMSDVHTSAYSSCSLLMMRQTCFMSDWGHCHVSARTSPLRHHLLAKKMGMNGRSERRSVYKGGGTRVLTRLPCNHSPCLQLSTRWSRWARIHRVRGERSPFLQHSYTMEWSPIALLVKPQSRCCGEERLSPSASRTCHPCQESAY